MIEGLTPEERANLVRRGLMRYAVDMEKVNRFLLWKDEQRDSYTGGPSIPVAIDGNWLELRPSGRMKRRLS